MNTKLQNAFYPMACALIALFLIASCARDVGPSEQAEKFLFAMSKGDMETAKIMVDDKSESVIVSIENARIEVDGKEQKIYIIDEDTNGKQAVVKYKYEDNDDIRVIRLQGEGEEWEVIIDKNSEDIIIGDQSLRKILAEVDLTVEEALALSADAVEEAINAVGKAFEEVGKALQDSSNDINISINGTEMDLEEAKEELKAGIEEALEDLQEALENN